MVVAELTVKSSLLDHVQHLSDTLEEVDSTDVSKAGAVDKAASRRTQAMEKLLGDEGRCDIETKTMGDLTPQDFRRLFFYGKKPVLITGVPRKPRLRRHGKPEHNDARTDVSENAVNRLLQLLTDFSVDSMTQDFGDQQLEVLVSAGGVSDMPGDQAYNMSVRDYVK